MSNICVKMRRFTFWLEEFRLILEKWAKRYGTSPGKMIYLPNVEVESEYNGDYMSVNVTAKPTKQD